MLLQASDSSRFLRALSSVGASDRPGPWIAATHAIVSDTYTNSLNAGLETAIIGNVCFTTGSATVADISRRAVWCLSCRSGGRSRQRPGDSEWAGLYISRRGCGYAERGYCRRESAWNLPSWLLFQRWRDGHNGEHHCDPQWPRRVHLQARRGADYRSQFLVTLAGGACANDVFWAPVGATTLGANAATSPGVPTFVGNIFRGTAAGLSITLGHFAHLTGRALAFGATVTTDSNTIDVPTCAPFVPPVVPPQSPRPSAPAPPAPWDFDADDYSG